MIDLECERLLSLGDAREWIGERTGRVPPRAALYRWASVGVGGVKLETVKLGGHVLTSVEALTRFANRENVPVSASAEIGQRRRREIEAAARERERVIG